MEEYIRTVQNYGRPSFKPIRGNVIVVAVGHTQLDTKITRDIEPSHGIGIYCTSTVNSASTSISVLSVDDELGDGDDWCISEISNVAAWQIALTRDAQRVNRARGNTSNILGNTSNVYKVHLVTLLLVVELSMVVDIFE